MEVLFTLPNGASVSDRDTFGIDLLSETRYNAVYRVSRVEGSSGPDPSKNFPSTIVSYSAYPLASVANSKPT
jgi:hypothetical protein